MLKGLARKYHLGRLRALQVKIRQLNGQLRTLRAEWALIVRRIDDLKKREPGMLKRFAAGARSIATLGVAVAGGIAAYQLGQDSSIAGQLASNVVGDKSLAVANAIGRSAPKPWRNTMSRWRPSPSSARRRPLR